MNVILIDLENVQPAVGELEKLPHDTCRVLVFVGNNQKKLDTKTVVALQAFPDPSGFIEIAGSGKNALDFHIAYFLGSLAEKEPGAVFHVVSKDTGFDPLLAYMRSLKRRVFREPDLASLSLKLALPESAKERMQQYRARLEMPKFSRPRTRKTLSSSINATFQKQLTDKAVSEVVQLLEKSGFLTISGEGKVAYREAKG
jgi:hypothetical protein